MAIRAFLATLAIVGAWVVLAFILPMLPALPALPGVVLSTVAVHVLLSGIAGAVTFAKVK